MNKPLNEPSRGDSTCNNSPTQSVTHSSRLGNYGHMVIKMFIGFVQMTELINSIQLYPNKNIEILKVKLMWLPFDLMRMNYE